MFFRRAVPTSPFDPLSILAKAVASIGCTAGWAGNRVRARALGAKSSPLEKRWRASPPAPQFSKSNPKRGNFIEEGEAAHWWIGNLCGARRENPSNCAKGQVTFGNFAG